MDNNKMEREKEKAYEIRSWVTEETVIGGMHLKKGDIIELGIGRKTVTGIFQGYDRLLYSFYIIEIESNEEMVIPYKTIKYLRKRRT